MNSNNEIFKAAYPAPPVSQSLRHAVANAALVANRRAHRMRWVRRIVRSGYAVAAVAVVVAIYPSTRAMATGRWLEGMLSDVTTAKIELVTIGEDGKERVTHRVYYSNAKWRMEDSTSVQIHVDGKAYSFQIGSKEALVRNQANAFGHTPTGFSMREARLIVHRVAQSPDVCYVHFCEGANALENGQASSTIGKKLAYLISDFVKARKASI